MPSPEQPDAEPPPGPPAEDRSFLKELKRRKVFQVAGTYLVVGWLVIQFAVAVFPQFEVPAWAGRFVILLVAMGFPIALVLAWAFELTPDGVKTTRRARDEAGGEKAQPSIQRRRNRLAILVGALIPAFALGIILGAVGIGFLSRSTGPSAPPPPAADVVSPAVAASPVLAVLPFVNMSPDADNAFFADGVHEDLLTNLSRISQLRVISRTSVMNYAGGAHNVRQIAGELGASHIIEGSVRRMGGRVRVTAQLIDAANDEHLWAERYDRDLDDIFAIQSQLADEIAAALRTELTPAERLEIRDAPTRSVEAYDLYLKARESMRGIHERRARYAAAVEHLREATRIDPDFADAWSRLAWLHASHVHFEFGDADEHLAAAERALARAKALAPDRMETLLAESYVHYHGRRDYESALAVLGEAIRREPGQAELLSAEAYVLRRVGRIADSLDRLREAARLDPRNTGLLHEIFMHLQRMGRMNEALEVGQRIRAMYPDNPFLDEQLFGLRMMLRPEIESILDWARRQESAAEAGDLTNFDTLLNAATAFLVAGETARAENMRRFAEKMPENFGPGFHAALTFSLLIEAEFRRDDAAAARHLERLQTDAEVLFPLVKDFDNAQFRVWVDTLRLVLAMRSGKTADADEALSRIEAVYEAESRDAMAQADLRSPLVRAEVLRHPERALAIYRREQTREIPGITFETVVAFPLLWVRLFDEPAFRDKLRASPHHYKIVQEHFPRLLDG
ncbi:MAG: hypothetical protein JJU00_06600 [Opitutales bacterium]|nr:hypothetical protein [Opitutales bacterium]